MRLLLTGSSCLEKSPLWSFGPQGRVWKKKKEEGLWRYRRSSPGRKEKRKSTERNKRDKSGQQKPVLQQCGTLPRTLINGFGLFGSHTPVVLVQLFASSSTDAKLILMPICCPPSWFTASLGQWLELVDPMRCPVFREDFSLID
ncbi:hypothetical protein ABVT39_020985 [Epinephelus coioides]